MKVCNTVSSPLGLRVFAPGAGQLVQVINLLFAVYDERGEECTL